MDIALSIALGLGLSAACGFRVFVPLLVMSAAAGSGHLELAEHFQWLATRSALIALAAATALEVAAYFVPWLDNVLDGVATPAAVVAGTLATAALVGDMDPFLTWTLAAIGGGGVAGLTQASTVAMRATSSALTGGLANPVLSMLELAAAALLSTLSLLLPLLALGLVAAFLIVGIRVLRRWRVARRERSDSIEQAA